MVNFSYNTILIVGATSGIGKGLAEKFIKEGKKIVIVGRREEQLQEFAKAAGKDKVLGYEVFDISKLDQIPSFVEKYVSSLNIYKNVLLTRGETQSHKGLSRYRLSVCVPPVYYVTMYF